MRFFLTLFFTMLALPAFAQSYRYIDDAGNILWVDSLEQVPLRYRNQLMKPTPAQEFGSGSQAQKEYERQLKKIQREKEREEKKKQREIERAEKKQKREEEKKKKEAERFRKQQEKLAAKAKKSGNSPRRITEASTPIAAKRVITR
jgi:hydroxymethylpyrimidine pyrophosphatase-like HAD family hydrolase